MLISIFIMCGQIFLGFFWIFRNIAAVPDFGDTLEYLELSSTFAPDEYRPILFPVILRIVQDSASRMGLPYQTLLYILQLAVSFCAVFSAVFYASKHTGTRLRILASIFFTAYLCSLPMIAWFNCAVLTDSFALSALIFMLLGLTVYVREEKNGPILWIGILLMYVIQALMRSDRTYSALVMILICILIRAIRGAIRKSRDRKEADPDRTAWNAENMGSDARKKETGIWRVFLLPLIMTAASVLLIMCVNHATQVPGSKGRVSTDASFIMLDRVVWPNMRRNYQYFPDEIKEVISPEEAKEFDVHNNNVMYQLAPLVESRVGKEKASEYYRTMAKIVWEHDRQKVIKDIAGTIGAFIILPQAEVLSRHKMLSMNTNWNIHCMSSVNKPLTNFMYSYYLNSFCVVFCLAAFICVLLSGRFRKLFGSLFCFIIMSVLLALWFGLGDGAPVNDRYALIVLVTWGLMWAQAFMCCISA